MDVASAILSTRDITNQNFLNAKYVFEKLSDKQKEGLLLNQGTINVAPGGFGVLVSGAIENRGTIIAPVGTIALAGGDLVRVDVGGNGMISIAIDRATAEQVLDKDGKPITEQIKNSGTLQC